MSDENIYFVKFHYLVAKVEVQQSPLKEEMQIALLDVLILYSES